MGRKDTDRHIYFGWHSFRALTSVYHSRYSAMKWWRHVSSISKNQRKIHWGLIRVLASLFLSLYHFDQNRFWSTSAIPLWNDGAIFIHYQISTQKSGLFQRNKFQQYSLVFVHRKLAWSSSRQTCSSHKDSLWSSHFPHNLNITFRV